MCVLVCRCVDISVYTCVCLCGWDEWCIQVHYVCACGGQRLKLNDSSITLSCLTRSLIGLEVSMSWLDNLASNPEGSS